MTVKRVKKLIKARFLSEPMSISDMDTMDARIITTVLLTLLKRD